MLEPLLKNAQQGEIEVYFSDAVHVIHGSNTGKAWSTKRPVLKNASGRKRLNVLGAYNPISKNVEYISNDEYINTFSVIDLMKSLRLNNGEKLVYLVLDNARYQKNKAVFEAAEYFNINLVYLPTYSPNLNLIERLWGMLRRECLNYNIPGKFSDFANKIYNFLDNIHTKYLAQITTLMTLNFHIEAEI